MFGDTTIGLYVQHNNDTCSSTIPQSLVCDVASTRWKSVISKVFARDEKELKHQFHQQIILNRTRTEGYANK